MAKSDRVIKRGVRVGGKTYTGGQEDELADALTAEEAERLSSKGYLEGNWKGKAKADSGKPADSTKKS